MSWRIPLDQDLIDTLKTSFPSWFPGGGSGTCSALVNLGASVTPPLSLISSTAGSPSELSSSTSPIAERSNSSSGVSSHSSSTASGETGGGTPCSFSFRSSSISSTNSYPPSPPSLVIYATQIEHPFVQRNIYPQYLADMAEGESYGCNYNYKSVGQKSKVLKSVVFNFVPQTAGPDQAALTKHAGSEPPLLHIVDRFNFDGAALATATSSRQTTPPKAVVDTSPLQPAMDRNKECKRIWAADNST